MNREIKFRVWNTADKKWEKEMGISQRGDAVDLSECFWNNYGTTIYVFQQYTGVKDKNGKEIFEGDIVTNLNDDERYCSPAVIVWANYEFVGWALAFKSNVLELGKIESEKYKRWYERHWKQLEHRFGDVILLEEFQLCHKQYGFYEVIGNIFENMDMFKDEPL